MTQQVNPSTAQPVTVTWTWDDEKTEAVKSTIDACVDTVEKISNKASKAVCTESTPKLMDLFQGLFVRLGFTTAEQSWSKPVADALVANCDPVIDSATKASASVAKQALYKSGDSSTSLAGYFYSWFSKTE